MNKRTITIIGLALIAGITALYMYLGGLNKVEYSVENVSDYNLVGVLFQGKGDSNDIEKAFFDAKDKLEKGMLDGVLTIVHYNDTTLEEDQVKLFIGVNLSQGTSEIPENYVRLTIPARRSMRASVEAHNVVMPSPATIENNLKEQALEYSLRLQDFTIEQYISENQLLIDMPAKQ